MKKLLLIAVMTLTSLFASAQDMWIGGSFDLGLYTTKSKGTSATTTATIGIAPELGYYFTDRVAIGAEMGVDYVSVDGHHDSRFDVGAFVRLDITEGSPVKYFGEVAMHYLNSGGFDVQLRPGLAVALTDHWSLVGRLSLLEFVHVSKDGFWSNTAGLHIGTDLTLGVAYNF